MGQKVHPIGLRLGISQNWNSQWISLINYSDLMYNDLLMKQLLIYKFKQLNFIISKCIIKRSTKKIHIIVSIYNKNLSKNINNKLLSKDNWYNSLRSILFNLNKTNIVLSIIETKNISSTAELLATYLSKELKKQQNKSIQLVLKRLIKNVKKNKKIKGVKILCCGRFRGVQMAKKEYIKYGKIPLNSINLKIDYAKQITKTIHGIYGIKIWIYK